MTKQNRDLLAQWLTAEAADAEERAEAALTALLEWLPEEGPAVAFTETVLAGVRQDARQARRVTWLLRVAAVVGIVLVGGSVLALPSLLLAAPASFSALIAGFAGGMKALASWLGHAVTVWEGAMSFFEKLALVLATPQATVAMLIVASLGAAAFRLLYGLTIQDRRPLHVDSI